MKAIVNIAHTILLLATFAIACDHYGAFDFEIPPILDIIVLFGVIGISVLWTVGHIVGGSVMGYAGGAMLDGIRMGFILGAALSIGRLWPYVMLWAIAAFFYAPSSKWWHTVGFFLLACLFFCIHRMVKYIWSKVQA